jgi:hypothetical protein
MPSKYQSWFNQMYLYRLPQHEWSMTLLCLIVLFSIKTSKCQTVNPDTEKVLYRSEASDKVYKSIICIAADDAYVYDEKYLSTAPNNASLSFNQCDKTGKRINDTVYYPGGEPGLQRFLFKNNLFNSSKSAISIPGVVVLRLLINQYGDVYDKIILRGVGGDIDEEAMRLAGLPVFLPATDSCGNAIFSEYILRVHFKIATRIIRTGDCVISMQDEYFRIKGSRKQNSTVKYPEGKRKMNQYFQQNYVCNDELIEGEVKFYTRFSEFGNISLIFMVESSDSLLTAEALRLLKSVKQWQPAIVQKEPVSRLMSVDVKFKKHCKIKVILRHID